MITYGKLNKNKDLILSDGRFIDSDGIRIANPTEELLLLHGYKRVVEEEPPEGVVSERKIEELKDLIKISYQPIVGG